MYHPLCPSMRLLPSSVTKHSQAIALDSASKVLIGVGVEVSRE